MKIERTKNAARNIFFGVIARLYSTVVPFVMRTAFIYFMGVKYLGLNSLFASVLSVLNLAELGVGSAMVYSMYEPIAKDDTKTICALMSLYRKYYRIIGLAIGIVGLCLTPMIPKLIKGTVPSELNVYVLYLMNLCTTVLTYWLFAYRNCLFNAFQRVDILRKIGMITSTIQYAVQLYVIIYLKNYYIYLLVSIFIQILGNIMTAVGSMKFFPQFKPGGNLDMNEVKKINRRVADLFTAKIGTVVVNSVDTIVISAFLGLNILAVYQNYFFIMTSVIGIIEIVFTACMAGIGNSIIVENQEKNFKDLKKLTFIICWVAGFSMCCFLCLYQPFMELWVGKELMLEMNAVTCLCIYFYIYEVNRLLNTYKDAAGIWHEDRFRPLITALSNLVMNLIMVRYWGLYGIVLSTVLSTLIVGMPWLVHNLFTTIFSLDLLKPYLVQLLKYVAAAVAVCLLTFLIGSMIKVSAFPALIIRGCLCVIIPNAIFIILFRNKEEFAQLLALIAMLTHNKVRIKV